MVINRDHLGRHVVSPTHRDLHEIGATGRRKSALTEWEDRANRLLEGLPTVDPQKAANIKVEMRKPGAFLNEVDELARAAETGRLVAAETDKGKKALYAGTLTLICAEASKSDSVYRNDPGRLEAVITGFLKAIGDTAKEEELLKTVKADFGFFGNDVGIKVVESIQAGYKSLRRVA